MNAQVTLPVASGKARRAAGLFLIGGILLFCTNGSAARPAEAAKPAEPAKPDAAATYVGSEACGACHDDIFKAFARNPHQVVEKVKARGWQGKACESCHGPGSKHAESVSPDDIINPAKLDAAKADRACLKCHLNQPSQANRIMSAHAKNDVSCVGCHTMHKDGPGGGEPGFAPRKPAAINKQCASCHSPVWAEFQRPHRHRLTENAMSCVDCHNPHGSFLPKLQKTASANEPTCLKCHGDKRGPFVFEHAPVRLEGCQTCHEPHGSANPRMLTRHEVRFQCLECHANVGAAAAQSGTLGGVPPAIHDLRSPRFRNCTICHMKVHGSQVNRALLR
ncbi:MAG: DmsE family decaheme c-type cytochrome [Bryobacterales bacterium]|nr:DmsE family decaheme c-type cytochrome [Bryobacterales bacterium]